MFVTVHVLAGALIGPRLRRHPVAAFAAGFASHLVMDATPHWGIDKHQPGAEQVFLRAARTDGLSGLGALAVAVATAPAGTRVATLAATVGAALPDIDKPCKHFFGFDPWPAWFTRFHQDIQRESPRRLPVEAVWASGLGAVGAADRRRPHRP